MELSDVLLIKVMGCCSPVSADFQASVILEESVMNLLSKRSVWKTKLRKSAFRKM